MRTLHVLPHPEHGWQITDPARPDAPTRLPVQQEAESAAREELARQGGGQLWLYDHGGQIRQTRVVEPDGTSHD